MLPPLTLFDSPVIFKDFDFLGLDFLMLKVMRVYTHNIEGIDNTGGSFTNVTRVIITEEITKDRPTRDHTHK